MQTMELHAMVQRMFLATVIVYTNLRCSIDWNRLKNECKLKWNLRIRYALKTLVFSISHELFNDIFIVFQADESSTSNRIDFEGYMVNYCQSLITKPWRSLSEINHTILSWTTSDSIKGMSLLHLAASLGYTRLVGALLSWRSENSNAVLDTEVDALGQDNDGYTPLVCVFVCVNYNTYFVLRNEFN